MIAQQICLNGEYYNSKAPIFYFNNRAFCYGDALFETVFVSSKKIPLLNLHYNRLVEGMKALKMKIPADFTTQNIYLMIEKLLNKNRLFQGVRVRISVFRNQGGLYTPTNNEISYLIETTKLDKEYYDLDKKGLYLGNYNEIKKSVNYLSKFKNSNSLIYVMAGLYKNENNFDDCLIYNQHDRIIESISSNLFIVKDKIIYTPSIDSGPVDGVMRKVVFSICKMEGYKLIEKDLSENDILSADEIFLTNAISGINWVLAYKDRRYYNLFSKELLNTINTSLF